MGDHVGNVWERPPGCFRWVTGPFDGGGPRRCPAEVTVSGWWRSPKVWVRVEACELHADEVKAEPDGP